MNVMVEELDLEAFAAADVPADDDLRSIGQLVEARREAALRVAEAEASLKDAQEVLRRLEENLLPAAMQKAKASSFTTEDGWTVSVQQKYFANISQERRAAAHAWLRDQGLGGLIKSELTVATPRFGRGEGLEVIGAFKQAKELLEGAGLNPVEAEAVHASTLKAFVKERLEKGLDLDKALFGVHQTDLAVVKPPKKKF